MTPSARRSRGRRSTSLPVVQSTDTSVDVFTINVAPNTDVMEYIFDIAHRNHVSVSVVSASGKINKVALQSPTLSSPAIMLHGPFSLVSLTGSYLYNNQYILHPGASPPLPLSFGINLSTSKGEVFCGIIGGRVVAGENVRVTVSTYRNPDILKYTAENQEGDDNPNDNHSANNNNNNDNNNPGDFNGDGDMLGFNPVSVGFVGGE